MTETQSGGNRAILDSRVCRLDDILDQRLGVCHHKALACQRIGIADIESVVDALPQIEHFLCCEQIIERQWSLHVLHVYCNPVQTPHQVTRIYLTTYKIGIGEE